MGARGRTVVAERFPREAHVDALEQALIHAAGTIARSKAPV
jgi:hypothetical protein